MTIGIKVQLRSGYSKGSMSGSNVEEISEQTRGRETKPIARGRGRKDKSRDSLTLKGIYRVLLLGLSDLFPQKLEYLNLA